MENGDKEKKRTEGMTGYLTLAKTLRTGR